MVAMTGTILGAMSLAATVGGTAMSVIGGQKKNSAEKQADFMKWQLAQEQIKGASLQQGSNAALSKAQIELADLQRKQNQLSISTNKSVIKEQQGAEDVRREQNRLTREENQFKLDSTNQQESIAKRNDILNERNENLQRGIFDLERQKDVKDRAVESTQRDIFARDIQKDTIDRNTEELQRTSFDIDKQKDVLDRDTEAAQRRAFGIEKLKDNLNRQNDLLIRQQDDQDRRMEFIQSQAAHLATSRQQRDFVRQGIAARASAAASSTAKGVQSGSSARSGLQANATSAENLKMQQTAQDFQITSALARSQTARRELGVQSRELGVLSREYGVDQRLIAEGQFDIGTEKRELGVGQRLIGNQQFELGTQKREVGVGQRLLGNQQFELGTQKRELGVGQRELGTQQFEVGTQARGLGVEARGVNYGVAVKGFQTADSMSRSNDQLFDINKNISNIYLSAQDINSGYVNQAYDANADLIRTNLQNTFNQLELQKKVFQLGGDLNQLNMKTSDATSMMNLGMGLTSIGGAIGKNIGGFDKMMENMFGSGKSAFEGYNQTGLPGNDLPSFGGNSGGFGGSPIAGLGMTPGAPGAPTPLNYLSKLYGG